MLRLKADCERLTASAAATKPVLVKGDEVAELAEIDMHFLHGKYRANAIAGDGVGFYKGTLIP